jgi:hypothetical protein
VFEALLGEESFAVTRIAVATVFALAALSKGSSFAKFTKTVAHYPVAGVRPRLAAGLLLAGEFAVAATLPFQVTALVGAAVALALLALFSATLLRFGMPHEHDCGCLGALPSARTSKDVVIRNVSLVFVIGFAALAPVFWVSPPLIVGFLILIPPAILILRPAFQGAPRPFAPSRRAALYKIAVVSAGLALLPVLRARETLACVCGEVISCGSCNHYIDSYYSGCCVNCTCSPRKKTVRRQWYKTCNICCEGARETYCYSTYPCIPC